MHCQQYKRTNSDDNDNTCIVIITYRLIDWIFTVLRPAQEFFTYMETSPLPVKGCKILAYARRSGPLSREGSLSCHTCCDTGPRISGLIRRTAPFSRLLRHTRGCGGSILTRILTGYLQNDNFDPTMTVVNKTYVTFGSFSLLIRRWRSQGCKNSSCLKATI
jgi:hypothetical protein